MKKVVLADIDKILLRKRSLIETVNDQLSQLEHSRYRSLIGFMVNFVGARIAYSWQSKKPKKLSLHLRKFSGMDLIVVGEDYMAFVSGLL